MKRMYTIKVMALLMSGAWLIGGCGSLSSLPMNMWKGFGYSLGAIPANLFANWVSITFGLQL